MDMAKKKPNENSESISEEKAEEPEETSGLGRSPEQPLSVSPPLTPAEQLAEILRLSEERTAKLEEKVMNLTNTLNQIAAGMTGKGMGNRPTSVIHYDRETSEEVEKPKGMNPMEIFKMITDIMNNPMVQKIADKFIGGGEEVKATQEYMPSQEEVKLAREMMAYKDGQMKKMDGWQERFMEATVKNLELINLKANKELESDLSSS